MKIRNHVCESCGKGFRDNGMYCFSAGSIIHIVFINFFHYFFYYFEKKSTDMLYIHTLQHRGIKFPCFVPGKTIFRNSFVLSHNFFLLNIFSGCTSAVTSKAVLMFHVRKNHSLSKAEQDEFKQKLADFWDTIKPKK